MGFSFDSEVNKATFSESGHMSALLLFLAHVNVDYSETATII